MIYALKEAKEYPADYIKEDGNYTYVCFLNPSLMDKTESALPVEEQDIWRIMRIEKVTSGGATITKITYPNGSATLFNCNLTNLAGYTYAYQK